ncbi:tRNA (guanine(10)-N2)-methyltransferase homolog [Argonauta hians]
MSVCRYLLHYANEHLHFRLAELASISELLGLQINVNSNDSHSESPYVVVELPCEVGRETCELNVKRLLKRTMMVRSAYELWAEGNCMESLTKRLASLSPHITAPYTTAESTFKIVVEAYNRKIPPKEKLEKIDKLPWQELGLKGKIQLKNPDHSFYLFEFYETEKGMKSAPEPSALYFGRLVAIGDRDLIQHYHLQKRCFIGNTSMDTGLSFIMANMGHADHNKLVFDPFVGTGSLLVSCAHFGCYVMGADLDYLLLHGKARPSRHNQKIRASNENIRSNLEQYGKGHQYIDAVIADSSKHRLWRTSEVFDAIITDPPYGIREPAKKIASNNRRTESPERCASHLPLKTQYQLSDIFKDLLNFSAKHLVVGGRLVYWLPVCRSQYSDDNVPLHPSLQLVSNSEQVLNTKVSRRLITMEKVKTYQENCEDGAATVSVDHYADSTFRERYFETQAS